MTKAALVLLALLGVLVMHAAPQIPTVIAGHESAHSSAPAPEEPVDSHHVVDPCTAVLPAGQALQPAALAAEPAAPQAARARRAEADQSAPPWALQSHAPPDLHALCISRT